MGVYRFDLCVGGGGSLWMSGDKMRRVIYLFDGVRGVLDCLIGLFFR